MCRSKIVYMLEWHQRGWTNRVCNHNTGLGRQFFPNRQVSKENPPTPPTTKRKNSRRLIKIERNTGRIEQAHFALAIHNGQTHTITPNNKSCATIARSSQSLRIIIRVYQPEKKICARVRPHLRLQRRLHAALAWVKKIIKSNQIGKLPPKTFKESRETPVTPAPWLHL